MTDTATTEAPRYDQGFVDMVMAWDALAPPRVDPDTLESAAGSLVAAASAIADQQSALWTTVEWLSSPQAPGWAGEAAQTFRATVEPDLVALRRGAAVLEAAGGAMFDAARAALDVCTAVMRGGDVFSLVSGGDGISVDDAGSIFSSARDAVLRYEETLAVCMRTWRTLADQAPHLQPLPPSSLLGELGGVKDRLVGAVSHPLDTEKHIVGSFLQSSRYLGVGTVNTARSPGMIGFFPSLMFDPRGTLDNAVDQVTGTTNELLHPEDTINAVVDGADLERGDFGAWIGRLGPDLALAVITKGLAAARFGADADGALLSAGAGAARLPMNMATVDAIAEKYGIDLSRDRISINKAFAGVRGATARNQRISLFRGAFEDEEQLAKTLVHEKFHAAQLQAGMPYPKFYDPTSGWERAAEAHADEWWEGLHHE